MRSSTKVVLLLMVFAVFSACQSAEDFKKEIEKKKEEIENLQTKIKQLQSQLKEKESEISNLKAEIEQLKKQLTGKEEEVKNIKVFNIVTKEDGHIADVMVNTEILPHADLKIITAGNRVFTTAVIMNSYEFVIPMDIIGEKRSYAEFKERVFGMQKWREENQRNIAKIESVLNTTIKDMSGKEYETYAFYVEYKDGYRKFEVYYYNDETGRIWGFDVKTPNNSVEELKDALKIVEKAVKLP